ncbi:hypothetical protein XENTR_v10018797 [Xenopus tropicalis]|nr:hypothetical protein XENTR_v10018797 [Xenopus tropicalis]
MGQQLIYNPRFLITLPHGSLTHNALHAHLEGGSPIAGQPARLLYPPSTSLSSTAPVAHLLVSLCPQGLFLSTQPAGFNPSGINQQFIVAISPHLLPSPTLSQTQFKTMFSSHLYIIAALLTGDFQ